MLAESTSNISRNPTEVILKVCTVWKLQFKVWNLNIFGSEGRLMVELIRAKVGLADIEAFNLDLGEIWWADLYTWSGCRIKITTRLRRVGTTWTPSSTMQWFRLRRAEGLSAINKRRGTDIWRLNVTDILKTWGTDIWRSNVTDILKERGDRHLNVICDGHLPQRGDRHLKVKWRTFTTKRGQTSKGKVTDIYLFIYFNLFNRGGQTSEGKWQTRTDRTDRDTDTQK